MRLTQCTSGKNRLVLSPAKKVRKQTIEISKTRKLRGEPIPKRILLQTERENSDAIHRGETIQQPALQSGTYRPSPSKNISSPFFDRRQTMKEIPLLTSFEIIPSLFRNLIVIPREFLIKHPVLLINPSDITLIFITSLPTPLLSLIQTTRLPSKTLISECFRGRWERRGKTHSELSLPITLSI